MSTDTTTAPAVTTASGKVASATTISAAQRRYSLKRALKRDWRLYLMLLLPLAYAVVFLYGPLFGLSIAFKNFSPALGIADSPWVGLKWISQFVNSYEFWLILKNTLVLNIYELLALFPLPIVLALLLNTLRSPRYSRVVQMITYAPHFISTVVVVGIILMLFSPTGGIVNNAIVALGFPRLDFLSEEMFRHTYVWSGAWQTLGYSAIIYLAALAGIDPQLHESAKIDGANILRRIWHIDMPGIMPVTVVLLILNIGSILSVGFEKVLLMQNPLNLATSEVIDTYAYRVAFQAAIPLYSYGTAVGLFKSVIALALLLLANWLARRVADESLF